MKATAAVHSTGEPINQPSLQRISQPTGQLKTVTVLDNIHRPVFYLKRDVSETEFCLRRQAEPTQLASIDGRRE
jgi:hypothetical protein